MALITSTAKCTTPWSSLLSSMPTSSLFPWMWVRAYWLGSRAPQVLYHPARSLPSLFTRQCRCHMHGVQSHLHIHALTPQPFVFDEDMRAHTRMVFHLTVRIILRCGQYSVNFLKIPKCSRYGSAPVSRANFIVQLLRLIAGTSLQCLAYMPISENFKIINCHLCVTSALPYLLVPTDV